MRRRLRKTAKTVVWILLLLAIAALGFCAYKIYMTKQEMAKVHEVQDATALVSEPEEIFPDWSYMDEYNQRRIENSDFVGWIRFDSGLINLPVMHTSNDYYLRRNFYKESDSSGTPFIDPLQTLDSKNITIYGHYVYADDKAMFTPLDKLRSEENYSENKVFRLYLDNEIRTYEVMSVVEYNIRGNWQFDAPSYSIDEWREFLQYAKQYANYETGVDADDDANYITLQTCIRNRTDDRTIVVGKEIARDRKE